MTSPQIRPGTGSRPARAAPRGRAGRRRRRWLWPTVVAVTALIAGTLLWFQPQKLLYDQRVDEPVPTAAPPRAASSAGTAGGAGAVQLATGTFVSREHPTRGTASLLRLPDGHVFVRFTGFRTSNGPALVVWLSQNPATGPDGAFADGHVDLGPLKGNVGDQNYAVPTGVDAGAYTGVVVWCARFHVAFGAADLVPAPGG